jgi:hypothetical protein
LLAPAVAVPATFGGDPAFPALTVAATAGGLFVGFPGRSGLAAAYDEGDRGEQARRDRTHEVRVRAVYQPKRQQRDGTEYE